MKTFFIKLTFKVTHYRDYKIICNESFLKNYKKTCAIFKQFKLVMLFQRSNLLGKRIVRGVMNCLFMNKTLLKAIILGARLRNTFLENRTKENQRNDTGLTGYCIFP